MSAAVIAARSHHCGTFGTSVSWRSCGAMPDLLIEDVNPYRTRRASLLAEDGNLYLYLSSLSGMGDDVSADDVPTVAAVWVANLEPAPEQLEPGGQRDDGHPPVMGREGTAFPLGCPPLRGALELVWFEEGDGVALLDSDGLVAVIPGRTGADELPGYARYSRDQTPLAWPLGPAAQATFDEKVDAARLFWKWRLTEGWNDIEDAGLAHLDARVGPREAYWRVDGGGFPEMTATRHRLRGHDVWITATTGLSGQPMPQRDRPAFADEVEAESEMGGRIELAVARASAEDDARDAIVGPASIPFSRMTWLGDGHIVDDQPETNASLGPDVAGVLLSASPPVPPGAAGPPDLRGLRVRGEPVTWLWVLALDTSTLALARSAGPEAALDALAAAGRTWVQQTDSTL